MPDSHRLRVPHEIVDLIRSLHPFLKKKVRAGLQAISRDPSCGKSLKDELEGMRSFRIKRFRIIYELSKKGEISIIALGPRKYIYEETLKILTRKHKDEK